MQIYWIYPNKYTEMIADVLSAKKIIYLFHILCCVCSLNS